MTMRALLAGWSELRARREDFIIATVVDVRGSAYRRPGARMLVARDRWIAGSVSGGCLEGDIVHKGFWRTQEGPVVVTYDSTSEAGHDDDDELRAGLGLGCNGIVDVLIERASTQVIDSLAVLDSCVLTQRTGVVATVFRSDDPHVPVGSRFALCGNDVTGWIGGSALTGAIVAEARAAQRCRRTRVVSLEGLRLLVEVFVPPPRLFVLGGGHDAVPVVAAARAIGWQVFVCLPHARPAARERFAGADGNVFGPPGEVVRAIDASDRAAAVIMHHDYAQDRAALAALAASHARYIGVLGPRHRTLRMLAELGTPELAVDTRLHAPVGLEVGAETPEEIAVAIVAEVQTVLADAPATRLRDRVGPIHAEGRAAGELRP